MYSVVDETDLKATRTTRFVLRDFTGCGRLHESDEPHMALPMTFGVALRFIFWTGLYGVSRLSKYITLRLAAPTQESPS